MVFWIVENWKAFASETARKFAVEHPGPMLWSYQADGTPSRNKAYYSGKVGNKKIRREWKESSSIQMQRGWLYRIARDQTLEIKAFVRDPVKLKSKSSWHLFAVAKDFFRCWPSCGRAASTYRITVPTAESSMACSNVCSSCRTCGSRNWY